MKLSTACAIVLLAGSAGSHGYAQTVHKCTVDGKVTYTEQPCQAGSAAVIAVPQAPAPDPAAAAELKRMQRDARTLERDRRQREAQEEREQRQASRDARQHNQRCAKLRMEKKWADDDVRGALVQNLDRAKVRAQRAADRLALECPG